MRRNTGWHVKAGVALIVLLCTWGLLARTHPTGATPGLRRFVTPEISPALRVGERFAMDLRGLVAIDVHPVAVGPVRGRVVLELRSITEGGLLVRRADVDAREFTATGTYRFEFRPIDYSREKAYRLEVSSSPADPANGVALRAARGDVGDTVLLYNGRERWGSLVFQTYTTERPRRPRLPFALAALVVSWMALLTLMRELPHSLFQTSA